MAKGLFVCLEGGEGCGKTRMAQFLASRMKNFGRSVREVADPGSTPLSTHIRKILLDASIPCDPISQALLYTTSRRALAAEVKAHLEEGTDIITGRWVMSTLVYQGMMGRVGKDLVMQLHAEFVDLTPDVCVLLDVPAEIGLNRKRQDKGVGGMQKERFEQRSVDWHTQLRHCYLEVAEELGLPVVNANQPVEKVQKAVLEACKTSKRFRAELPQL